MARSLILARAWVYATVSIALALLLVACGGGKDDQGEATQTGVTSSSGVEGAESPEAAVRNFLKAFADNDRDEILNATDPARRNEALEFQNATKVSSILNQAGRLNLGTPAIGITALTYTTQNQDLSTALVQISGKLRFQGKDEVLDKETLPLVKVDGRWFVTSTKPAPTPAAGAANQPAWMTAMLDASPSLPGVYIPPHPGVDLTVGTNDDRLHVGAGSVIPICTADQIAKNEVGLPPCYTSNPPTSGPHTPQTMVWSVLTQAAPKENLVHNMEHGGIVVWYNSTNQQVITQLAGLVTAHLNQRDLIVMSPYAGMEPETIAITAWTRMDKFPVSQFTADRVEKFIEAHKRRFNPEGF